MRKINSIIAIIAISLAASSNVSAQQSATATANGNANVIAPISISNDSSLEFGNIAVSATESGTVVIGTDGNRTQTDGVRLVSSSGTAAAASFTVVGEGDSTYDITLPTSLTLTGAGDNSAQTMTVDTFTSNPDNTGTLSSGSEIINVGATLNVSNAQAISEYTSLTGFDVTVNYN